MALVGRLTDAIRRIIREEHLRTWDRNGGPGAVLRLAMRRPAVTAVVVAIVLAAVLVATFGVPPFSPLGLIVLVVAPIGPWLRAERAVHAEWVQRGHRADGDPSSDAPPDPDTPDPDAPDPDAPDPDTSDGDAPDPDTVRDPEA